MTLARTWDTSTVSKGKGEEAAKTKVKRKKGKTNDKGAGK